MKKVIGGALYNTDTAQKVGHYWNGRGGGDFSAYSEDLYRTKAGKFFIHGEGGPMTRYAVSCGNNSWGGGEKIIPMSATEARAWAEERLGADEYITLFGEPEEAADGKAQINLSIRADLKAKLERIRSERGISITAIVEELVDAI